MAVVGADQARDLQRQPGMRRGAGEGDRPGGLGCAGVVIAAGPAAVKVDGVGAVAVELVTGAWRACLVDADPSRTITTAAIPSPATAAVTSSLRCRRCSDGPVCSGTATSPAAPKAPSDAGGNAPGGGVSADGGVPASGAATFPFAGVSGSASAGGGGGGRRGLFRAGRGP